MRTEFSMKFIFLVTAAALFLFLGCTEKKTTEPAGPDEPTLSLMHQYFPLNHGDRWTWEVTSFQVEEEFVDGDCNLGEPYLDTNRNGIFDQGENYEDLNGNGRYDGPDDPWEPPIPYLDRNGNGTYDAPDSLWQQGELFLDLDGNGVCDTACTLTLHASILYPYPQDGVMILGGQFLGTYSNGEPGGIPGPTDLYSNDSLGLRFHDGSLFDALWCTPLILAQADPQVGDSMTSLSCRLYPTSWISVFEAVEDVSVPAGSFRDCFKFRFIASGWIGEMTRYNGTSYRWYAKNAGLVKVEGPEDGEYWILKSATVGGRSYP